MIAIVLFGWIAGLIPAADAQPSPNSAERHLAAQERKSPGVKSGFGSREFAPFFFVQAGDPQITGTSAANTFRRLGEIVSELQPAFVIACGDLLNIPANSTQTSLFHQAAAAFEVPLVLVPGNHDMKTLQDLSYYREHFGADYYHFVYNGCEFIVVNSEPLVNPDPYAAEVAAQWSWLETEATSLSQQTLPHTFISLHHPPFRFTQNEGTPYFQPDSPVVFPPVARQRMLNAARTAGCDTFFAGHVHETRLFGDAEFKIYTVGGTSFTFDNRAASADFGKQTSAASPGALPRLDGWPQADANDPEPTLRDPKWGLDANFGYRIVKVFADRIESIYVRIDQPSDTTPPGPPADLAAAHASGKTWSLTWSPGPASADVITYQIYRDGELIAVSLEPSLQIVLPYLSTHGFTITATDVWGNVSPASALLSVTTGPNLTGAEDWRLYR